MNTDIDWTKPLRMADGPYKGSLVRCICSDRKFSHEPEMEIVILIDTELYGEILATCTRAGRLYLAAGMKDQVENWEGVQ